MWTIFLLVGPFIVHWIGERLGIWTFGEQRVLGVALFIAGGSLGLISGYTMARIGEGTPLPVDTARKLVIAGPYRFIRNPMAVAGTIQSVATGIFLGSPLVLLATVFSAALWNYLVRPPEEADLLARFGEPYREYSENVRCWVPQFPGVSDSAPH